MNLVRSLNSIKKDQWEKKATWTEIKNNLWRINSTVDEAKIQTSDLEYKETKNT